MAKREELLARFLNELEKGTVPRGGDFRGIKIKGLEITGATLDGVNLPKANLSGAMIASSSLMDANLERANLNLSTLIESNLSGVNLKKGRLKSCRISSSNLSKSDLSECNLALSRIEGSDLSSSTLRGSNLSRLAIQNCSFAKADLSDVISTGISVKGTDFSSARFTGSILEGGGFEGGSLTFSEFRNVQAISSSFENVDFTGTDLKDSDFTGSSFTGCIFDGADLRGANFDQCRFEETALRDCALSGTSFQGVTGLSDEIKKGIRRSGGMVTPSLYRNIWVKVTRNIYFRIFSGLFALSLLTIFFLYLLDPENKSIEALEKDCERFKERGEYEKAERYYRIILEKVKGNSDMEISTLFSIGEMETEEGDYPSAVETFKEIVERAKKDIEQKNLARSNLAGLYARMGKVEMAKDLYETIISDEESSSSEVGEALASLARLFYATGKEEEALDILTTNLERFKGNLSITYETNLILAEILRAAGKYDQAFEIYERLEKLVTLESQRAELEIMKARVMEEKGDFTASMELYEEIIRKYPDNPDVSIDVKMEIASMALRRGNHPYAMRIYQNLLKSTRNPDTRAAILLTMGRGLIDLDPAEGEKILKGVMEEFPERKDILLDAIRGLVDLHMSKGEFQKALSMMERLEKGAGRMMQGEDHLKKAGILINLKRYEEGMGILKRVMGENKGNDDLKGEASGLLAEAMVRSGDVKGAMEIYESLDEGMKEREIAATILNRGAGLLLEKKRLKEAKRLHQKVIEGPAVSADALSMAKMGIAGILEEEGRVEEALGLYREVAGSSDPESAVMAMEAIAVRYMEKGDYFRAIDILRDVSRKVSGKPEFYFSAMERMAEVYTRMGKVEEALRVFDELVKNSRSDTYRGLALLRKAELLSDSGQMDLATLTIEEALSLYGTSFRVREKGNFIMAQIWRLRGESKKALAIFRDLKENALDENIREMASLAEGEMKGEEGEAGEGGNLEDSVEEEMESEDPIMESLKEADSLFQKGEYQKALPLFEEVEAGVENRELLASIRIRKGEALYHTGEKGKGEGLLKEVIEGNRDLDDIFLNASIALSGLYREEGREDEALELLREASSKRGDRGLLLRIKEGMAEILLKRGRWKEVEDLYRGALKGSPAALYPRLLELAQMAEEAGEKGYAMALYKKIKEGAKGEEMILASIRGMARISGERGPEHGLKIVEDILKEFEGKGRMEVELILLQAEALMEMGRAGEAIRVLKRGEGLAKGGVMEAKIGCALADAYSMKGEKAASLRIFNDVLRDFGEMEEALFMAKKGIAGIRREQKRREEAVRIYEELLDKVKDEGHMIEILNLLEETYEEMGKGKEAQKIKDKIEALSPSE